MNLLVHGPDGDSVGGNSVIDDNVSVSDDSDVNHHQFGIQSAEPMRVMWSWHNANNEVQA